MKSQLTHAHTIRSEMKSTLLHNSTEVLLLLARKILSVKRHLAVTNVSSHWYLFTQWSMIKDLITF